MTDSSSPHNKVNNSKLVKDDSKAVAMKQLPMDQIATSFHAIWSKPLHDSYVTRDFARLANKFFLEVQHGVPTKFLTKSANGGETCTEKDSTCIADTATKEPSQSPDQSIQQEGDPNSVSSPPSDEASTSNSTQSHPPAEEQQQQQANDTKPSTDASANDTTSITASENSFHRIGFRREDETDQMIIIVEALNAISQLLNEDLDMCNENTAESSRTATADTPIPPSSALTTSSESPLLYQHTTSRHQDSPVTATTPTPSETTDSISKYREPLIDAENFKERVFTLQDCKPLSNFLEQTFDENGSRTLRLLKCCDQAFVVCLLGHLGLNLFTCAQLRFKDLRPSTWKVIIRKYKDTYSVVHRRRERALRLDPVGRLIDLFTFEWEVEIIFDSKKLHHIEAVCVRLLDINWSDCPDSETEYNSNYEQSFRDAFKHGDIRDLKCHLGTTSNNSPSSSSNNKKLSSSSSSRERSFSKKKPHWHLFGCISRHDDMDSNKKQPSRSV